MLDHHLGSRASGRWVTFGVVAPLRRLDDLEAALEALDE
jgi:hypothetical protein